MHIDGDFKSNKGNCPYHCSPTCHPMQTGGESGTEWFYGCTHKAWPQNRMGDFVPIVECDGDQSKCGMRGGREFSFYLRGLKARRSNAAKKMSMLDLKIEELEKLIGKEQPCTSIITKAPI